MINAIYRAELRRLLRAPMLWLVYALMMFLLGYLFLTFLDNFRLLIEPTNVGASQPKGVTDTVVLPVLTWAGILLLAIIPLLTAGAISEARRSGRWTLLAASPAKPWQIVSGIYLAHLTTLTLAILLIALIPVSLYASTEVDTGKILFSLFALWLMTASFLAAGIYCSAVHKESAIVVLLAYSLLLFLFVLQLSANLPGVNSGLLYYLSHWSHFPSMLDGRLSSVDIIYYLVFLLLFLLLAIRKVASYSRPQYSWSEKARSLLKQFVVLAGLFIMLWLSLHYPFQTDISSYTNNSVDPLTISRLKQMPDEIRITAVVENKPALHRQIKRLISLYQLVKPNIKLNFVNLQEHHLTNTDDLNTKGYLLMEYQQHQEKVFSTNKGLIAVAIGKLLKPQQDWILFLEGHGERSIFDDRVKGFEKAAQFLKQQGYQIAPLNLLQTKTIPDNTTVLVIAAPAQDLLKGEAEQLLNYVKSGGNLLWLHDEQSMKGLGGLMALLPFEFMPGIIVDSNTRLRDLLGVQHPAVIPVVNFASLNVSMNGETVVLPLARGLVPKTDTNWSDEPVLLSNDTSWNETGELQGQVNFDEKTEQQGPLTVGIQFSRTQDKTQQRIAVIGDADFMSNDYLGLLSNSKLTQKLFDWLSRNNMTIEPIHSIPDSKLEMSQLKLNIIGLFYLLVLPLLLMGYGAWQWRRAKRSA